MRTPYTLAFSLLLASVIPCQTLQYNEVVRFGQSDLVQSKNNTTTGYALELPGAQPAGFTNGKGVPAGTLTWIWYPSLLNARFSDREVTGHLVGVRPGSATPKADYSKTASGQSSAGVPLYIPKFSIWPAKARAAGSGTKPPFGWGFDPDFSKVALFQYTTQHTYLETSPDLTRIWAVTYSSKATIKGSGTNNASNEMVLAFEWKGGEKISTAASQSIPSGASENSFKPVHWGFASPGTTKTITHFDPQKTAPGQTGDIYTSPFGGYFENHATLSFHSDWGESRDPLLGQSVYPSYNPGSGLADVAGTVGKCGFDVYTSTAYAGFRALPIVNLSGPHNKATSILGQTVELNLSSQFLSFLWNAPNVDGVIDKNGVWLPTSRVTIPKLGAIAIGSWIGVEFILANPKTGQIVDTTGAYWLYIEK